MNAEAFHLNAILIPLSSSPSMALSPTVGLRLESNPDAVPLRYQLKSLTTKLPALKWKGGGDSETRKSERERENERQRERDREREREREREMTGPE